MKKTLVSLALFCCCTITFAAEQTARLFAPDAPGPLAFAAGEIKSALKNAGWNLADTGSASFEISLDAPTGAGKLDVKPESFAIEVSQKAGITRVRIRGADARGAMYGGLDAAEQIRMKGPLSIRSKSETPLLVVRAMKFNPPLKGNVYMAGEDLKNSDWFYDLEYWDRFMRMMAYNRYNALTLWSSHPYDHMVRFKKYPEAATLPRDQLDKNIVFFHKLFQMAKNYGLDTYLVTWNIHMSSAFRSVHKVRDGQDSPLIRDYQKECIRELISEYPELTGLGTCPGEKMSMSAAANAEWIRDVYLDTLAATGRRIPFIYRYWGAQPKETAAMLVKAKYPGEILLDIKFNGEHMYSSTQPHPEEMRWLTQAQRPYKLLWHLRNDCIFQLRWGDPEFAGKILNNCGGAESAGFVMGSEIEIPGADRYHTPEAVAHRDWNYEFEKNWMRFAVWGRMGYDPKLSDDYWIDRFSERFGPAAGKDAFLALNSASKIIPAVTSFHWNYMNGDWYPEGNVGSWNTSDGMEKPNFRDGGFFHGIRQWVFNNVIDDSLINIPDYVACTSKHVTIPKNVRTPSDVAAMLRQAVDQSEKHAVAAAAKIENGTKEWQCTLLDLQASAALGRYYADKIDAALTLMRYLANGDISEKEAAVDHLESARDHWKRLAKIMQSHYVTHEIWLLGQFDWAMYLPQVEKDIEIARTMKPWTVEEQTWTSADGKNIATSTRWRAVGWPKGIEPWAADFNARRHGPAASIDIPAGSRITTTLNADSPGIGVLHISAPGIKAIRVNDIEYPVASAQPGPIAAKFHSGSNRIALQYDSGSNSLLKKGTGSERTGEKPAQIAGCEVPVPLFQRAANVVPTVKLEEEPATIFLEAEEGQLTSPMRKMARSDAAGGFVVVVPIGSGRGEIGGKVLDNGYVTYKITIPDDGRYRVSVRVYWPDDSANSFFYAWDGGAPKLLGNDSIFRKWHWIETPPSPLEAGEHTLVIRNRDEGSILNCITVVPEKLRGN